MDYLLNLKQIWTPELQLVEMSKAIPELTEKLLAFDGQQKQPWVPQEIEPPQNWDPSGSYEKLDPIDKR